MFAARLQLALSLVVACCGMVRVEAPPLPGVTAVPPTGQAPLSSAHRPGNEYADLDKGTMRTS